MSIKIFIDSLLRNQVLVMKIFLIVSTLLLTNCGISDDHESSTASNATGAWGKILECQNGELVIDVNSSDRRNLQVVIRNPSLFQYSDANMNYGQLKNPDERIYRGQTPSGIFDPSQFVNVFEYDVIGGDSQLGFEARKYGDSLIFRALDFVATQCGGSLRGNNYANCEVANYIFKDCR